MENLPVGTVIEHDLYGKGAIVKDNITSYDIIFARAGEMQISKRKMEAEVVYLPENAPRPEFNITQIETMIRNVLDDYGLWHEKTELGEKWINGTIILRPGTQGLKEKEIPIEVFFHKIVMLRDRLRVLEQNINSNAKLNDEEKINLQQYITRIYGSLTTFNLLFQDKNDYFVGQKSD
ncbi:MAG TPA: hypothetical protein PLM49_02535 [Bacteroidales bacterium]|nr:hypothetical protein [Bacteroidales bacterium]